MEITQKNENDINNTLENKLNSIKEKYGINLLELFHVTDCKNCGGESECDDNCEDCG